MTMEEVLQGLDASLSNWLDENRVGTRPVARGTIAGALLILEGVADDWPRDWESFLSDKVRGQLKRCSGERVQEIIARFGKHNRLYSQEGGRTNRAQRPAGELLFELIQASKLDKLSENDRRWVCEQLQRRLYDDFVKPWYENAGVQIKWNRSITTQTACQRLLESAKEIGATGVAAQHIVGAALALANSSREISNHPVPASDSSTDRSADFEVGNAAIHVTVAPANKLLRRCDGNLDEGLDPIILTTAEGSRYVEDLLTQNGLQGLVAVLEITQFVHTLIEQIAGFEPPARTKYLYDLLVEYNRRIRESESDRSACVRIPKTLEQAAKKSGTLF